MSEELTKEEVKRALVLVDEILGLETYIYLFEVAARRWWKEHGELLWD